MFWFFLLSPNYSATAAVYLIKITRLPALPLVSLTPSQSLRMRGSIEPFTPFSTPCCAHPLLLSHHCSLSAPSDHTDFTTVNDNGFFSKLLLRFHPSHDGPSFSECGCVCYSVRYDCQCKYSSLFVSSLIHHSTFILGRPTRIEVWPTMHLCCWQDRLKVFALRQ